MQLADFLDAAMLLETIATLGVSVQEALLISGESTLE
jgi:hypothetical protein